MTEQQLSAARKALCGCPLFEALGAQEKEALLLRGDTALCSYVRGESIFSAGQTEKSCLYLLLQGRVQIFRQKAEQSVLLNELSAGAVFGAASLFCEAHPYPTGVVARQETTLLCICGAAIEALVRENGAFALSYVRFLSGRVRFLNNRIAAFTAGSAAQRLGAYLCILLPDGTKSASLSCSRLAKQLDMGRASLYRALDSLAACGAIERNGKQIRLLDPAKCMDPPREAESQKKTAKETKREG